MKVSKLMRKHSVWAAGIVMAMCLAAAPVRAAITYETVLVGDPGNPNDSTGYGAVTYEYRIGKYEVTIGQYTEFLNAVDPSGTNPYSLYNNSMGADGNIRGILFSSGSASGQKYSPIGSPNRPITYVSWFDAARFANWMHNGQGSGSTETGAYTLVGGQTSGEAPGKNDGAQFYIPTENEWYKAAYFSPVLNSGAGGYYDFATQSDTSPGNTIGNGNNQANWYRDTYAVTQAGTYDANQNYLTDVGAFTNSMSYYGTFDQTGNVWEWTATGLGDEMWSRGGDWFISDDGNGQPYYISRRYSILLLTNISSPYTGFRLASPVAVPEPSTYAMALAGLVCGGFSMWRRRSRA